MSRDVREYTHTDGVMNPAPEWAHRLLDLAFGGWSIMPTGGLRMNQHSVTGQVYSAWTEYGKTSFTVDFREQKSGVWTAAIEQPQPDPVPPEIIPVDEWLERKAGA